jgi:hypothetical protein
MNLKRKRKKFVANINYMSSLILQQQKAAKTYSVSGVSNILKTFFHWAEAQNDYRFVWLGIALLAHASLLTPFTAMAVMTTSGNFTLIMACLGAMGLCLVTNLAALPTKITIPAFILSILIDVAVVVISFSLA